MSVRVYTGTGTSRNGAPLLVDRLSEHLSIPVSGIKEDEMRGSRAWERETTTLIFPGQSVGQFKEALGPDVQERIRQCVYTGAFDYIGICAGVAFASSQIKYRMAMIKPNDRPIIQTNGLALFNGLAAGPCQSISPLPYSGGLDNLALIRLRRPGLKKSYNAFFWGGPAIIPMEKIPPEKGRLLAHLESDGTPLAIQTKYGEGKISLFSFHPEINADNVGRWAGVDTLSDAASLHIKSLARQLDGTAFDIFLEDSGLAAYAKKKEAAPQPLPYNFNMF